MADLKPTQTLQSDVPSDSSHLEKTVGTHEKHGPMLDPIHEVSRKILP